MEQPADVLDQPVHQDARSVDWLPVCLPKFPIFLQLTVINHHFHQCSLFCPGACLEVDLLACVDLVNFVLNLGHHKLHHASEDTQQVDHFLQQCDEVTRIYFLTLAS